MQKHRIYGDFGFRNADFGMRILHSALRPSPFALHNGTSGGTTFIEVMVAVVVLGVVAAGIGSLFTYGLSGIEREAHRRMALELAQQRMEELTSLGYGSVMDTVETGIVLGDLIGTRTTSTVSVDDSADGTGATDVDYPDTTDYKRVTVEVAWGERAQTNYVALETVLAP